MTSASLNTKKKTRTLHKFLIRTVGVCRCLTKHLKNVPEDKGTREKGKICDKRERRKRETKAFVFGFKKRAIIVQARQRIVQLGTKPDRVQTFYTRADRPWGPTSNIYPEGQSGRGVALTTHPHLAPRLKKKYSYTPTPPLGFHAVTGRPLPFKIRPRPSIYKVKR